MIWFSRSPSRPAAHNAAKEGGASLLVVETPLATPPSDSTGRLRFPIDDSQAMYKAGATPSAKRQAPSSFSACQNGKIIYRPKIRKPQGKSRCCGEPATRPTYSLHLRAMSQFDSLSKLTSIVADTGDIKAIKTFKPEDATTNPSLILKATKMPEYKALVEEAVAYAKKEAKTPEARLGLAMDRLAVNFGAEISKIVPGVVSTEVDARLSFDTAATIAKARSLCAMYKAKGVDPAKKVLIKIASTWEGIQAARVLEKEGIRCNMTLLFSMCQAVACAEADATLISPFVGRIMDWYTAKTGTVYENGVNDPGVESVTKIYNYYKRNGYKTIVMGASFRNLGQILELAGCDKLTIGPKFLKPLSESKEAVARKLDAEAALKMDIPKVSYNETSFRWALNEDAMATEKLSEGIRKFAKAAVELETIISKML